MRKKVLVFPCGSVTGIDINFALRNSLRVELYGASSVDDHGVYIYRNYIGGVPNISESGFLYEFNKILYEYKIDFIIPTHDTVALFLKESEDKLYSKVICSDLETTKICRYKSLTYDLFRSYDFIPNIYNGSETDIIFPVFLKPDDGQGGKGSYIANSLHEMSFYLRRSKNLLICEYLPGDELTIDCFTDSKSNLRFVSQRSRERTLAGISVRSRVLELEQEIYDIAEILNGKLRFRGHWFFQLKRDNVGKYKLLEISTRLAGTACVNYNLDVNFPLLSILDFSGEEINIYPNSYNIEVDRTLINRYRINYDYERVYIDFDDTMIFNNKYYNQYLFMFIYQCLNKNKEIVLITKHNGNIRQTLNSLKICEGIFNKIIEVESDDYKYKYMGNDKKSIFIDNSFAERMLAKEKLGIPSFDVSNIECLLDWRG